MSNKEGMPRLMAGEFRRNMHHILYIDLLVGLYWEGGPPTDVADRINASFPNNLMRLMHTRVSKDIADADR